MIELETLGPLVPGPAAAGVECLTANNNLDLIRFDERLYLVWRTAPTHFASADARLEVSSAPSVGGPWRHETTVALGADVREPRFVADGRRLTVFFMQLGTNPRRFQPQGIHRIVTEGDGWSAPEVAIDAPVVPWRIRRLGGRWVLIGYRNAEKMYSVRPTDPVIELHWSDDLENWDAPVDLHDGGTECELVELPDGRVLGLTRNEGPTRRGGDLIMATDVSVLQDAPLHRVSVTPIDRKLDSPNLFVWNGEPFVIARRQVAHGGRYDVVPGRTPGPLAIRVDQLVWWLSRKRSALYRLDPDRPSVAWELDLPSRGDTSFAAVVPEPDGTLLVADYTSSERRGDVMWLRGQLGPTEIHLHRLSHH